MWAIAGVLLGLVVLSSIVGFHVGPHSHVVAGVIGSVTAIWLLVMALTGNAVPLLWVLLSADLVVTTGVATAGYKGLKSERALGRGKSATSLTGAEGIALSALDPQGLVRVRGETWSATSLNGTIAMGGRVQIIEADSVRLKVWGEDGEHIGPPQLLGDLQLEDINSESINPGGDVGRSSVEEHTNADYPTPEDRRAGTA
jgi:membrane-bound ClpP family serine protease